MLYNYSILDREAQEQLPRCSWAVLLTLSYPAVRLEKDRHEATMALSRLETQV